MIRISGGHVFTPDGWIESDVWIDADTVVAMGHQEGVTADLSIDADEKLVGPGFVDLHTHLREPGQTWKEDIESGSRAAAAGGYTAIVAMPNTLPPIDTPQLVEEVRRIGATAGWCHIAVAACLTVGRKGLVPADVPALRAAGVEMFTDDGDSVADPEILRKVMKAVASVGGVVAQHAEDVDLSVDGHMHLGAVSLSLGVSGIPSDAEWSIVTRDIDLARATGAAYHAQHLSTEEAVGMVKRAKDEGMKVTAEVTPHHLCFEEVDVVELDTNLKMYPPLRGHNDRKALIDGLRDGTIDVVATDHAPHTESEKEVPFPTAPRGVIGLETAASAVWEVLGDPSRFFEVMSVNPARIAGLSRHGVPITIGSPANIVIFDPREKWVADSFVSKSRNSPYLGREMTGRVVTTVFEGRVTRELEGSK